ncbi:MAG: YitT family protein [Desulfobulbaceae bacterium]|nr:YitT family protein [Desulfobulbaceae bacterium]
MAEKHFQRDPDCATVEAQPLFTTTKKLLFDLILIVTGCIIGAVAVNGILIPNHFATGGITGLSLIIHEFLPFMNLGWIYLLTNIPLFVLAWMSVGRRFFFYSLLGTLVFTLCLKYIHFPIQLEDKILSTLLAGLIFGTGTGIVLRSSGSQGGLDILSVMLYRRFAISLGNTVLTVNIIVLSLVAIFYSLDAFLYTLIVIYVSSKITDIVVTGLSQRKAVFIISSHWETIAGEILKDIRRGVTVIEGQGGFTGKKEKILYAVVPLMDIGQMKILIRQIDPEAFVVISNTLEVINNRIGNQPHW